MITLLKTSYLKDHITSAPRKKLLRERSRTTVFMHYVIEMYKTRCLAFYHVIFHEKSLNWLLCSFYAHSLTKSCKTAGNCFEENVLFSFALKAKLKEYSILYDFLYFALQMGWCSLFRSSPFNKNTYEDIRKSPIVTSEKNHGQTDSERGKVTGIQAYKLRAIYDKMNKNLNILGIA